jgi:hypothetical protein
MSLNLSATRAGHSAARAEEAVCAEPSAAKEEQAAALTAHSLRKLWINPSQRERIRLIHVEAAGPRRFTSLWPSRAGLVVGSARFYARRVTMNGSEFQAYHAREAARLRRLIAHTTTPGYKGSTDRAGRGARSACRRLSGGRRSSGRRFVAKLSVAISHVVVGRVVRPRASRNGQHRDHQQD